MSFQPLYLMAFAPQAYPYRLAASFSPKQPQVAPTYAWNGQTYIKEYYSTLSCPVSPLPNSHGSSSSSPEYLSSSFSSPYSSENASGYFLQKVTFVTGLPSNLAQYIMGENAPCRRECHCVDCCFRHLTTPDVPKPVPILEPPSVDIIEDYLSSVRLWTPQCADLAAKCQAIRLRERASSDSSPSSSGKELNNLYWPLELLPDAYVSPAERRARWLERWEKARQAEYDRIDQARKERGWGQGAWRDESAEVEKETLHWNIRYAKEHGLLPKDSKYWHEDV